MKTHTTITLRKLVLQDLCPQTNALTAQEISVWLKALPLIDKEMHEQVDFFTESLFSRLLKAQQIEQIARECTRLLDVLDNYPKLSDGAEQLRSKAGDCLMKIYRYCLNSMTGIADELRLPKRYWKTEQAQLQGYLMKLQELPRLGIQKRGLTALLLRQLKALLKAACCTGHRLNYLKQFIPVLLEVAANAAGQDDEWLLIFLVEREFNLKAILQGCKDSLKLLSEGIAEREQKLNYIDGLAEKIRRCRKLKAAQRFDIGEFALRTELLAYTQKLFAQERVAPMVTMKCPAKSLTSAGEVAHTAGPIERGFDALLALINLLLQSELASPAEKCRMFTALSQLNTRS